MAKFEKTIVVDFDGVLHWYRKGWHDGTIYDEPTPGAQKAMEELLEAGYRVVIFSTRAVERLVNGNIEKSQWMEMKEWLLKHKFPFPIHVHSEPGKPIGIAYIDDRAVRFNGDWRVALQEAMTFKPWNLKNT